MELWREKFCFLREVDISLVIYCFTLGGMCNGLFSGDTSMKTEDQKLQWCDYLKNLETLLKQCSIIVQPQYHTRLFI
jgi:hypothetical protein